MTFKKDGLGRVMNLGVGMVGALIGRLIFNAFRIVLGFGDLKVTFEDLIAAFLGSLLLIVVRRNTVHFNLIERLQHAVRFLFSTSLHPREERHRHAGSGAGWLGIEWPSTDRRWSVADSPAGGHLETHFRRSRNSL